MARCNHGYVFIDDAETGELLNLYPVGCRSGNETLADTALTAAGYVRTTEWTLGNVHGEIMASIDRQT